MDTCEVGSGCTHTPVPGACYDGDPCSTIDFCKNGKCVAGPVPSCTDGDPCTTDTCDPVKGCSHTPLSCDDGDPCTFDTCTPGGGCLHVPDAKACTCGGAGAPEPSACGDIPVTGVCSGDTLVECVFGEVVITPCGDVGRLCGWDDYGWGGQGAFACVVGDGQSCDAVPDSGSCDGDLLTWCDTATGTTVMENCAAHGGKCGWTGSFFCCHEPGACIPMCSGRMCGDDGCGGTCGQCPAGESCTDNGLCAGCDGPGPVCPGGDCGNDNECQKLKCAGDGGCANVALPDGTECYPDMYCGGGQCNMGYCVPDEAEPLGDLCGDVPVVGVCDGHILSRCKNGKVEMIDCAADDMVCGWDTDLMDGYGAFGCYWEDEAPCVGIPDSGMCDGTILTYCDQGEAVHVNCAMTDEDCGWTGSFHCCHPAVACVPLCNGRECGSDGCGGTCGACGEDQFCADSGLCYGCEEALPPIALIADETPVQTPEWKRPERPMIPAKPVPGNGCGSSSGAGHSGAILWLLGLLMLVWRPGASGPGRRR